MNRKNIHIKADDPSDVAPVLRSKNPISAALSCGGKVMPPTFIESGPKINTREIIDVKIDEI